MEFRNRYGNYEFPILSLGLTNAPVAIMVQLNRVFRSFLDSFVIVFIDNIIVYSKNEGEHMDHLRVLLQFHKET